MFTSDKENSTYVVQHSGKTVRTNNNFMQKLTEVFQPVIDHKIAYDHLVNEINEYRKSVPKWYATEKEMKTCK